MKLKHHIAISTVFSGLLYAIFKSWNMALACFLSGIIIDIDYVIDYLIQCNSPYTLNKFNQFRNDEKLIKVRIFHGWEWVVFWSSVAWVSDWNLLNLGILIGFGQHILLDNINCRVSFWRYSLIWRWMNGFQSNSRERC